MTKKEIICTLDAVTKPFGRGPNGLGPLSLSLFKGDILGIRGPNGAGKSTLLKILATISLPTSGVYLHEKIDAIGYVPQEIALYETMTGLENLRFWGRVYGLKGGELRRRSLALLHAVALSDKAKERLDSYSGGMKRRLHLASALMATPQLLLLDEPTVGADAHSVRLILAMLRQLRSQGCSIVFISHQQDELKAVCDRIFTLDAGRFTHFAEDLQ